jgi:hypothetical protein
VAAAPQKPDRLDGLSDLDQAVVPVFGIRIDFFEIRRENGVNHVQFVLQDAVLLLELPDAIEQFFFRRHETIVAVGFALWIDTSADLAWAQGTHEYRPMGTAVVARTDQFRRHDFQQTRQRPPHLENAFAGFYGSLEDVNAVLRAQTEWKLRWTPGHLR